MILDGGDPRGLWEPVLADVCGIHPWIVGRYKPHELESALAYARARIGMTDG